MRLASVTLARDEADIIEVFVRHNLHFVDCMYIIDDGSTDATRAILDLLQGEGLPLVRIEDGAHAAYNQGRRTTGLMHRAMRDEAWDFIFALDADEFIAVADRATLEAELDALPEPKIGAFSVTNYFPHADDDATDPNPLSRLTHVLDLPRGNGKVIVPSAFAAHPETLISDGNHIISRWHAEQPVTLLATADLAHFPVRSDDQLVAKCMVSYIRWRARPDYKASTASHHIEGARALMKEPGLLLERPDQLLLAYIPQLEGPVSVRPFVQRRATPRYLDLARTYPYRRVLASLDALVEGARAGTAELNALRIQVTKAQAPFHLALAAALRKMRRSFLKRWLSLRMK